MAARIADDMDTERIDGHHAEDVQRIVADSMESVEALMVADIRRKQDVVAYLDVVKSCLGDPYVVAYDAGVAVPDDVAVARHSVEQLPVETVVPVALEPLPAESDVE